MQYLTAETYAAKLVTVPDNQYDNYLLACRRTVDDPREWYQSALKTEIDGPTRQARIAKLNRAKSELWESGVSGTPDP